MTEPVTSVAAAPLIPFVARPRRRETAATDAAHRAGEASAGPGDTIRATNGSAALDLDGDFRAGTARARPNAERRSADRRAPSVDRRGPGGAGRGASGGAGSIRSRRVDSDRWADLGPLSPYIAAGNATDIFVNGSSGLWVDTGHGPERDESWQADERSLRELAVRLISLGGRHIDETSPCVDVRLHDGMRVHAVLPPISTTGTLLSIRIPRPEHFSLGDLADVEMVSADQCATVERAITNRENLLVTGASGSGKTTLLSAILAAAPPGDRIVAIEDVAELRVEHPHFVSLESRQANLDGAGAVGMDRLVREALRMRPDRLVVGECRGAEIRELLSALNTGHDGGAGTLHANTLADVPARIEALGALAGLGPEAIARQTVSAIGLVLHLEWPGGVRKLNQMGRFRLDAHDRLRMVGE